MTKKDCELSAAEMLLYALLIYEDAPHLRRTHKVACVSDLRDMHVHEGFTNALDCYNEWLRRLGGKQNIPAYARTLLAGKSSRRL